MRSSDYRAQRRMPSKKSRRLQRKPILRLILIYTALLTILTVTSVFFLQGKVMTTSSFGLGSNLSASGRIMAQISKIFGIKQEDDILSAQSSQLLDASGAIKDEKNESFFSRLVNNFINTISKAVNGISLSDPVSFIKSELPIVNGNENDIKFVSYDNDVVTPEIEYISPGIIKEDASEPEVKLSSHVIEEVIEEQSTKEATDSEKKDSIDTKKQPPTRSETDNTLVKYGKSNFEVAIMHTHSSEAYTASQGADYLWAKKDGITSVGDALAKELFNTYKINTLHSEKVHDYPDFTKSYVNSLKTMETLAESYKSLTTIIDLHRDAYLGGSENTVTINGVKAARILLVVTNEDSGLPHPNWKKNYEFAQKLNDKLNELYPGLSKGVSVKKNARLNQHVHPGAIIVEIGNTNNTKPEANATAKFLAKAIAQIL